MSVTSSNNALRRGGALSVLMAMSLSLAFIAPAEGLGADTGAEEPIASLTPQAVAEGGRAITDPTADSNAESTVPQLMSRYSSTERNADGSYTMEYSPIPVNYRDESGQWRKVDNTLVEAPGVRYAVENAANEFDVSIPENPATTPVRFEHDGSWLTMLALGAESESPSVSGAEASFGVGQAEVTYEITNTGLKETIQLDAPPTGPVAYKYDLEVSPGLTPVLTPAQQIDFEDAMGSTAFSIPRGFMTDSAPGGGAFSDAVTYELRATGSSWRLVVTADVAWLNDAARVYPVAIDPTVDAGANRTCWLQQDTPNASRCGADYMQVGRVSGANRRGLIDLTVNNIPAAATVQNAQLFMWQDSNMSPGAPHANYVWHRASAWGNGATWSNSGAGYGWNGGSPREYASSAVSLPGSHNGWVSWDVTGATHNWRSGAWAQDGLALLQLGEGIGARLGFISNPNQLNGLRPIYRVDYTLPNRPPTSSSNPVVTPQGANSEQVVSLTPTIYTTNYDPTSNSLKAHFHINDGVTDELIYSAVSNTAGNTQQVQITVPAGVLTYGRRYSVMAIADDGEYFGPWSSKTYFQVQQPQAPQEDPEIKRILELSRPGTTSSKVRSMINEVVAMSGEAGKARYTFDEAKRELLDFAIDSSNVDAARATSQVLNSCQWTVSTEEIDSRGDSASTQVSVSRGDQREYMYLTDGSDPTSPEFAQQVGSDYVTVTLWKGASPEETTQTLATGETQMEALEAASVSGAVDGEADIEVESRFSGSQELLDLEVIGYRLEAGESVERGALTEIATNYTRGGQNAAADCDESTVSSEEDVSLDTAEGKMFVPGVASQAESRTYPTTTSAVRYRTFIPGETVNGLVCGRFVGDNRGFTNYFGESRNKSRVSVFFNWPDQTIDATKKVGTTERLDGTFTTAKKKTASTAGISVREPFMTKGFGRVAVSHSVGNPLCSVAGPISYNIVIEVFKDGPAHIIGTRGRVPNHEAYYYPTSGAFGDTIFTKSTGRFFCLSTSVFCGFNQQIEESSE